MMGSKQKTAAKNSSVVPDSEKSIIDSTSSPPNDSLNARTRLQEKEKLGGLNDRLAIYMERVRSLETENARLHIQVRESELIEKSTVRGVEKQYESKISQLRNEFEAISRDKAKLEMEQSKTADACKDMRSAAERLKIEIKVAEKHIGDDYGRMQDLKATLRDRKGHCELAEKELQTLKKEEEGCKKEIGTIRNQLDNEVLLRKDLQNKLATYKDDLEFTRCNSNKAFEEFRSKRQSEMNLFSAEVENRYQAKLQDQLQTMRADFDHRIAESRAEVDARYQGKLAKAKEDDDRSRENALKAKQESARYRLKMEELEKAYAENNIDVNALNSKIVELENSLRYLSEFNDVRLQERDEKILEMEASLNAMMEEFRSLMDVKVQLDTELLAYQKLLEGEEIRLNIIAGKGGCQAHRCAARLKKIRCPGSSSLLFVVMLSAVDSMTV